MSERNIIGYVPQMDNYLNLTPFKATIIQNFPFLCDDFDSLSNIGYLQKIIEYLNNVIENENIVNHNTIALYNAFVDLHNYVQNYFNNLDVQDEINNKLDDMVEDGTLTSIISAFLNSTAIWCFDNVQSMKNATNLINGSYARTLGYYNANDEGGSIYKIRTKTGGDVIDNATKIAIGSTLVAVLQNTEEINIKQFGAKGDGETDETSIIQKAFDFITTKGGKINFTNGTFMIDAETSVYLKSNTNLDFVNAKLKAIPNDNSHSQVLYLEDTQNCVINNAVIVGERNEHTGDSGEFGYGIYIRGNTKNIHFNNLKVTNCWGDGVFFYRKRVGNVDYIPNGVYFNGTTWIENCRRQGVSMLAGQNVYFDNLICKDINGTLPMAGIDLESEHEVDLLGNIHINYLKCIGTNKCFTMRTRSRITGDISIGTIEQVAPITIPSGNYDVYVAPFRVFFEYFNNSQGGFSVSVENIIAEHGTVQLSNLYNKCTPRVNIGNIYTKQKEYIYTADPDSRGLIGITYDLTTALTNELGNLFIDNILIENLKELNDHQITLRPYIIKYLGENTLETQSLNNVIVNNIRYLSKADNININEESVNILCKNVYIHTSDETTTIFKQNSGAKTLVTKNNNKYVFVPVDNSQSNKIIYLRVGNSLKNLELITKGNTNVVIDTKYRTTYWDKVFLNDVEIELAENDRYPLGNFTEDTNFIIKTIGSYIYVETY